MKHAATADGCVPLLASFCSHADLLHPADGLLGRYALEGARMSVLHLSVCFCALMSCGVALPRVACHAVGLSLWIT
jgi:hypothetical protein